MSYIRLSDIDPMVKYANLGQDAAAADQPVAPAPAPVVTPPAPPSSWSPPEILKKFVDPLRGCGPWPWVVGGLAVGAAGAYWTWVWNDEENKKKREEEAKKREAEARRLEASAA